MMKKALFCLVAALYMPPVFADVYKWKDANGKIHYGDVPNMAGTAKVKTDEQTEDQIDNGERIRKETEKLTSQDTARNSKCEALLDQLHDTQIDLSRQSVGEVIAAKNKRYAIVQEYELRCKSPEDRQAKKTERSNTQKQQKASCNSDWDCGNGKRCVKPPYNATGTCMKSVNEYGVQQYSAPKLESVMPNMEGKCLYDTDCPIGFRCDSKYKACIK